MVNILHFIKTSGVVYDDRLCKEVGTLQELGASCEIIALESRNEVATGETLNGVGWSSIRLRSRRWFPLGKGLLFKTAEMYFKFFMQLLRKKPQVAWIHNLENLMYVVLLGICWKPFGRNHQIVWDLHEYPPPFYLKNLIGKLFMKFACKFANTIVSANAARIDELMEHGFDQYKERFVVIENFPAKSFIEQPKGELPSELSGWLDGAPYFLIQGLGLPSRMTVQSIQAVLGFPKYRVVVLGPLNEVVAAEVEQLDIGNDRLYVTGMTLQAELYHVIDHAYASLVFYGFTNENNRLCAPNRLYQAVCRGIPLVCGCNPSMKSVVDTLGNGVATVGDGSVTKEIVEALKCLIDGIDQFRDKADEARGSLVWESQLPVFERIITRSNSN